MIIEQTTDLGEKALQNPGHYNGFLGVSIRNKFFSKKNISAYIEWASSNFKEFNILLMDDADRHNFMIFKGMDEDKALQKAREISNTTKMAFNKIISTLKVKNVKVVQFIDFEADPLYTKILAATKEYMKKSRVFEESLYQLMRLNIGARIDDYCKSNNLTLKEVNAVKERLLQYIIEELASLLYFTEKNFKIEIDPTPEFETKKFIYEKHFPEFFEELGLTQRGHIYAAPEGTSYYKNTYGDK